MKRRSFLQGLVATIAALPATALARSAQPRPQSSVQMDDVLRSMLIHDIMRYQDRMVMQQLGMAL